MARTNLSRIFPIALSPARIAQALDISPNVVRQAIREKKLGPVMQLGLARRILVRRVEKWILKYWREVSP